MLTRSKYVPLFVVGAILIAGAWTTGHSTSPSATRTTAGKAAAGHTELERLRTQVTVLTAQKESAEAALADTQRRLNGCRQTIRRYWEELAYVDEQLEALKGGEK
jgi:chromosome segregation ATPase